MRCPDQLGFRRAVRGNTARSRVRRANGRLSAKPQPDRCGNPGAGRGDYRRATYASAADIGLHLRQRQNISLVGVAGRAGQAQGRGGSDHARTSATCAWPVRYSPVGRRRWWIAGAGCWPSTGITRLPRCRGLVSDRARPDRRDPARLPEAGRGFSAGSRLVAVRRCLYRAVRPADRQ